MTPSAPDAVRSPLTVATVTTAAGLAALQKRWQTLLALTPCASGFQSLAWITQCWEHFHKPGDALFVSVLTSGEATVAIFPTQLGTGGRLRLIGTGVSNYGGPVYRLEFLEAAVSAWASYLGRDARVRAIDLAGLREDSPAFGVLARRPLPGWGAPVVVETNVCPEVELAAGWEAILGRHRRKHRSAWKRQGRRLAQLGELRFVEIGDPVQVAAAMPRLVELFQSRWETRRTAGGFSATVAGFQTDAAVATARAGHVALSQLILDEQIIAFAYGIRAGETTTSYVIGHDGRFGSYSLGLLLTLKVLEAAARRGDPVHDFSLGDDSYKSMWATRERKVFRLLWGRRRRPRAWTSRAWTAARGVPVLRKLKLEGPRATMFGTPPPPPPADAPGLPAGSGDSWAVHRVAPASATRVRVRRGTYGDIRDVVSPRLLALALERSFRGDELVVVEDQDGIAGVAWRAAASHRERILGQPATAQPDLPAYFHPVAHERLGLAALVAALAQPEGCVVAAAQDLPAAGGSEHLRRVEADRVPWAASAATAATGQAR